MCVVPCVEARGRGWSGGAAGVGEGRSLPHPLLPPDGKMVMAVLSCPGVGDIMQRHAICN